jgi:chaperonin GroES
MGIKSAMPFGERVLIRLPDQEKKTKSGIIIPDSVEQKTKPIGEVVAIGNTELANGLKPGMIVQVDHYGLTHIQVGDKPHVLVKMQDILAVLELETEE